MRQRHTNTLREPNIKTEIHITERHTLIERDACTLRDKHTERNGNNLRDTYTERRSLTL